MATKIFGWVLLIAGIILIGWTLLSTYNIFTGERPAPEIFKVAEKEAILPEKGKVKGLETMLEEKMKEMMGEQLKEIFPTEFIPKLLNLIVWSILAGILIFGGAQISSFGIKLIKR